MLDINLEKQLPIITMNFAEVKASLGAYLNKYKNLLITEETAKDCKSISREIGGKITELETLRKETKKEMSKPIDEMEDKFKELVSMYKEVKVVIEKGVSVFDQAKRDKLKQFAIDTILEATKANQLNEKYASRLIVLDEYMNLTAKVNHIKEDVESRAFLLANEQAQEIEKMQIIKDTIENLNKNIDAKMSIEDFQSYIDMETATPMIIHNINARAERIKENELKAVEEKKARAEKEVQERIAKAEKEAILKAEKERIAKETELRNERISQQTRELQKISDDKKEAEKLGFRSEKAAAQYFEREPQKQPISLNIDLQKEAGPVEEPILYVEMRVEGTLERIMEVSRFLKNGGYDYKKLKDGRI